MGVLQTIYRWRKAIRNVCLLALVLSIGFSLLLKNYYKATTIFYPASPQLSNPELLFGYTSQVTDYFGSDRDLDRISEIAGSSELVDFMVQRFNLYEHYGYDSTAKDGAYKVRKLFLSLYSAQKNKNDAIELTVEDTDPALAAEMANTARNKINEIAQQLSKKSQARLLLAFDDNINRKKAELLALSDSLRRVQAYYGIYDPEAQGEQLSEQMTLAEKDVVENRAKLEVLEKDPIIPRDTIAYIRAKLRASERREQQLSSQSSADGALSLKRYNEGLPMVSVLRDLHFQARKQLSYDLERYNQIKSAYNTDIPAIHVIETAERPLIKSRPKRSVIVLASVAAACMFTVLAALLADTYREINWKNISSQPDQE